jgi:replicative DNA helicase
MGDPTIVLPPHDENAEATLIATMMADWSCTPRIRAIVKGTDFWEMRWRWMFEAIVAIPQPDPNMIEAELARMNVLDECGGAGCTARLLSEVWPSLAFESVAQTVKDYAVRRQMVDAAQQILRLGYDTRRPVAKVVECAHAAMRGVSGARADTMMAQNGEVAAGFAAAVERAVEAGGALPGIKTGVPWGGTDVRLDDMTLGWERGDLIVIAGRPGAGKTAFMLNSIYQAAIRDRKRVGVFSLEMRSERLYNRLVAVDTGIDSRRIRRGALNEDELARVTRSASAMGEADIVWKHVGGLTPSRMIACVEREASRAPFDLVVTDYLQLMEGDGGTETRSREIDVIGGELKALASADDGGFDVPVMVGSQLNRASTQTRSPGLEHMREGAIENPADKVVILNVPDENVPNLIDVILRKNRDGETGVIKCYFDRPTMRFKPAEVRRLS